MPLWLCFVSKIDATDAKLINKFTIQEVDDSFKNYKNNFSIVSCNKILHGISIKNEKEGLQKNSNLLRL